MLKHAPVFLCASLLAGCAIPIGFPGGGATAPTTPLPASTASAVDQVIEHTNSARTRNRLPALAISAKLAEAARLHAEQMAAFQEAAHTISDARYPTMRDRLAAVGYMFASAAENVAWNQRTAGDVMNIWLNSTGHRANIMDSTVTEIGVAVAYSQKGEPYWIQVFGRPR